MKEADIEQTTAEDLQIEIQMYAYALENKWQEDVVDKIFSKFDKNKNGFLERDELKKFFQTSEELSVNNIPITEEFIDSILEACDEDHNKMIDKQELNYYVKTFFENMIQVCKDELTRRRQLHLA